MARRLYYTIAFCLAVSRCLSVVSCFRFDHCLSKWQQMPASNGMRASTCALCRHDKQTPACRGFTYFTSDVCKFFSAELELEASDSNHAVLLTSWGVRLRNPPLTQRLRQKQSIRRKDTSDARVEGIVFAIFSQCDAPPMTTLIVRWQHIWCVFSCPMAASLQGRC